MPYVALLRGWGQALRTCATLRTTVTYSSYVVHNKYRAAWRHEFICSPAMCCGPVVVASAAAAAAAVVRSQHT